MCDYGVFNTIAVGISDRNTDNIYTYSKFWCSEFIFQCSKMTFRRRKCSVSVCRGVEEVVNTVNVVIWERAKKININN